MSHYPWGSPLPYPSPEAVYKATWDWPGIVSSYLPAFSCARFHWENQWQINMSSLHETWNQPHISNILIKPMQYQHFHTPTSHKSKTMTYALFTAGCKTTEIYLFPKIPSSCHVTNYHLISWLAPMRPQDAPKASSCSTRTQIRPQVSLTMIQNI